MHSHEPQRTEFFQKGFLASRLRPRRSLANSLACRRARGRQIWLRFRNVTTIQDHVLLLAGVVVVLVVRVVPVHDGPFPWDFRRPPPGLDLDLVQLVLGVLEVLGDFGEPGLERVVGGFQLLVVILGLAEVVLALLVGLGQELDLLVLGSRFPPLRLEETDEVGGWGRGGRLPWKQERLGETVLSNGLGGLGGGHVQLPLPVLLGSTGSLKNVNAKSGSRSE